MASTQIALPVDIGPSRMSLPSDEDHHIMLPGIWTLIHNRGLNIDPKEMSPFFIDIMEPQSPPQQQMIIKKRKEFKRTLFTDAQRNTLMQWLKDHQSNPYPTSTEKQQLMAETGLNRDQINVWFTNNRVRHGMSSSSQHHKSSTRNQPYY